jgi:acetyltransferase (GNAT) family protein
MTEGGETFLLAEDAAGEIIAFCSYKAGEAPDWARGGVGRALLVRAEAAIAAAGHRRVTTTASLTGRPFYEAQGYAALRQRAWTTRGGLKLGVFEMAKSLARWRRRASAGRQDRLAAEILRPSRAAASSPHDADREPS